MFCWICPYLVPHLMVPCTAAVCAIFWWYMLVWLIFFPDQCLLLESLQSSFDVSWNGDVQFVVLVIPIKREYNIFFTIQIF